MDTTPTIQTDSTFEFKELKAEDSPTIVPLANKLHPEMSAEAVSGHLAEMFKFPTYRCFGLLQNGKLVAVTNGWITVRFYSGKQLEVDNVIVDPDHRSKGIGQHFFACIDQWARENNCHTIELNTYVQNSKSHKFYFNEGYKILGFHFQKVL